MPEPFTWISVKDRLPDDNQSVLIWSGRHDIARFKRATYDGPVITKENGDPDVPTVGFWWKNRSPISGRDITHWAELPDPPVNKKSE